MLFYLIAAAVPFLISMVLSVLPCGVASAECTNPLLPIPPEVGTAFESAANGAHYFLYLAGEPIGSAVIISVKILMLVYVMRLVWDILLYFKVPVVSNIMNMFRLNVNKE